MWTKKMILFTFPLLFLIGIYFLGPQPETPVYDIALPEVPDESIALEKYVSQKESQHKIKPNNEAEIVWRDSTKSKTPYSVVYLHGFGASKMEGDPVHRNFARQFGCNMFLSRLSDHGIDTTETLLLFTADRLWNSAKEALAIASKLGDKVIIMSTSTGGTVALKLAAEYPDIVYGLINLSPNIEINHPLGFMANDPWGLYIARAVFKGKYRVTDSSEEHAKYWNKVQRLESAGALEELIETTMNEETFARIKQPSLTLYYYKNEKEQDTEVRVDAMLRMNKQLGTPEDKKVTVAIPNAGAHVIGCSLTSKDVPAVYDAIVKFAKEKLLLNEVQAI
jgi:pimeloyl-ACP methyl ester carboxylesterase